MNESLITDTLFDQIMAIRSSGKANMLDTGAVQYYANQRNFFELVVLIEENERAYIDFILTGER